MPATIWLSSPDYSVGPHSPINVLERSLAQIDEVDPSFAADIIVRRRRDTDAAWLRQALKPRCDVDAVSEDVMWLNNYVTNVDTNPERNAPFFRVTRGQLLDAALEQHRSSNRFDGARKLGQEPVAGILDDPAAAVGDCWINSLCQ